MKSGDGTVVCWGDRAAGGDAHGGESVRQVAASARAFAAVLEVARMARMARGGMNMIYPIGLWWLNLGWFLVGLRRWFRDFWSHGGSSRTWMIWGDLPWLREPPHGWSLGKAWAGPRFLRSAPSPHGFYDVFGFHSYHIPMEIIFWLLSPITNGSIMLFACYSPISCWSRTTIICTS